MTSTGPVILKTRGSAIICRNSRIPTRALRVLLRRSSRTRLFAAGKEFDMWLPFRAKLSLSPEGHLAMEDILDFFVSPQIIGWMRELEPGQRLDGCLEMNIKNGEKIFIFSLRKNEASNWSISLFNCRQEADPARIDQELIEEADRLDQYAGPEIGRLHGTTGEFLEINHFIRGNGTRGLGD